ncbi:Olfactory Receptor 4P4 [Manis pentadactyla]|nr:Olfactory Receptor 4P4 [Manis pentadactyla]
MVGNVLILVTITASPLLETPMYFFLAYLSFIDACYSSCSFSKDRNAVRCGNWTALLTSALKGKRQARKARVPLTFSLQFSDIIPVPIQIMFKIDHYFCDVFPLLKLACTDTSLLVIAIISTTGVLSILTFVALVISYIIVLSTLRTRSSEGRRKALSTCGSHVTVVFMFFLPLIFTYAPMADSVSNDKVFSLFYTMIAPMFNPLIYTLRNTDMKNAMRRVWCRHRLFEEK